MAKFASTGFYDGAYNVFKAAAGTVNYRLCSAQPTTIAECASLALASTTLNKATEITLAVGDVSGRKMTIAAKLAIAVSVAGTGNHVAIDNGTDFFVTTATSQAVSSGGTVDIATWKDEIASPA